MYVKSDSQLKGLEVELQDGTIHSICMEEDDKTRTVELIVPDGEHIKEVYLDKKIKEIDTLRCFGVRTSGPHNEPTMFSSGCKFQTYLRSKHRYLYGLSGKTYKVANGTSKMATLAFHFATVGNHEICKSEDGNTF